MEICSADPACPYFDDDLVGKRNRTGNIGDIQRPIFN
jgi:hypothetical protein